MSAPKARCNGKMTRAMKSNRPRLTDISVRARSISGVTDSNEE
jgi:hypothetical protein